VNLRSCVAMCTHTRGEGTACVKARTHISSNGSQSKRQDGDDDRGKIGHIWRSQSDSHKPTNIYKRGEIILKNNKKFIKVTS